MGIPIIDRCIQGQGQLVRGLKPAPFQCQGAQLLPPRLNQVQPTGVFGDELQLHFGPGGKGQFSLFADMDRQVFYDDQLSLDGKGSHDLFQQLHMTGTIPAWTEQGYRLSRRWLKSTMHPQLPATSIVWFKGCSVGAGLPFFSRIGFDRSRSHFIATDYSYAWQWVQVRLDDAPLFSTNWGSCFSASWNQLSWRFQRKPSASTHSQMVESERWTPFRSWNADCNRSRVHKLNGYPIVSGFCCAKLIKALHTLGSWVRGRPAFGLSSRPATPSALKRLTQVIPDCRPLKPACWPAWVAYSFGSSNNATITFVRWTSRWAAYRDAANLRISVSSSIIKDRSFTAFRHASYCFTREDYGLTIRRKNHLGANSTDCHPK